VKEKHSHKPYVIEFYRLDNYNLCIAILGCSEVDCEWKSWDWGTMDGD